VKTIGLIGGMSWESTVPYYQQINEVVKERLGGLHSAKLILYSLDFQDIEHFQQAGEWEAAGKLLAEAARSLQAAGAEFLALCTNTMHKVASMIEAAVRIPLLHIADPTAMKIREAGYSKIGLLGTRFTMEQDFYTERLRKVHGLHVLIPKSEDRELVHRIIYDELCLGRVLPGSRAQFRRVIGDLKEQGAQAVILGCTEISLLVSPEDSEIPVFDTTRIHARSVAEWALAAG
jgi:aspartate racemase